MKCCKRAFAFLIFASLSLSSTSFRPTGIHSQSDEDEFNYDEGSGKGPSRWGSLKPEWQTCSTGKLQSPIDIPVGSVQLSPALGDLQTSYASSPAVLKNRGHDIAVLWNGDAGKVNINGTDYKILQCHWHSPSEHTFDGTRHDLEIHIVHQNAQNQIAVVSMVFQFGQPDPFLSALLSSIKTVGGGEKELGNVNPGDIGFVGRQYYRYTGSLSTPPCTEGVIWTVFQQVKTASPEQVQALKDALTEQFKENSRPTQPLGGRLVSFYEPGETDA
ncbi:alpha carbonic anhydrase 4-like isoform X2 [Herrania umbratica]|uniref:Alpha carbonic anhydrase 4-like isoform X2 n=1 Tax=Herrania umbratica TaxID=108875 RepID=A0A6J1A7P9_9ROSI|nr:alpha carbonic anhydrase 4-like isoform X2 [Herrania umbratica]